MRCQVPRVLVDVLGVHEDGWMRWVAVEPCQLELRVSLWGDQSPESPFSILHLAGLWPQGVATPRPPPTTTQPIH